MPSGIFEEMDEARANLIAVTNTLEGIARSSPQCRPSFAEVADLERARTHYEQSLAQLDHYVRDRAADTEDVYGEDA